jgi:hypothetical protein
MTVDQYGIPDQLGAAGAHLSPEGGNGTPTLRDLLRSQAARLAPIQATRAALKTLDSASRSDGMFAYVSDGSVWRYVDASVVSDTSGNFALTPDDNPTTGRWLRVPAGGLDISASFTAATADAAALITLPTNALALVRQGYWKVAVVGSGGATPTMGLSSNNAAYNTAGDLLGGAAGDGASVFGTLGIRAGTIGAKTAAGILLVGGNTIRLNKITSAFTTVSAEAHLVVDLLANPGV